MNFPEAVKRETRRIVRRVEERFGALPAIGAMQMVSMAGKPIVVARAAPCSNSGVVRQD
jgi:hypothetical protein